MNIQHSSRTDLWYSPLPIVVAAKEVLGPIDLDPASDAFGNARIGAKYFITREMDGLVTPWIAGTVFLNPPGGKVGNRSLMQLFWQRLVEYREAGDLKHAIFFAFSLEALQSTQRDGQGGIGRFPLCIPERRVAFDSQTGPGNSPSHSNAIVYVPGSLDKTTLFAERFRPFGLVR